MRPVPGDLTKKILLDRMAQGDSYIEVCAEFGHDRGIYHHWRKTDKAFDKKITAMMSDRQERRRIRAKRKQELRKRGRSGARVETVDLSPNLNVRSLRKVRKVLEEICGEAA